MKYTTKKANAYTHPVPTMRSGMRTIKAKEPIMFALGKRRRELNPEEESSEGILHSEQSIN
jgi:hypothetical protein